MSKEWTTKSEDMHVANEIMEAYASEKEIPVLGLLELVVNTTQKRMDFQLANWVHALAIKFNTMYGANHGDYVTRQVLSSCLTQGQILH